MQEKHFYLGRWIEPPAADQTVLYDPADLTTHAVAIGMTGSGKTGLLIGLLEEAALQKIPAIVIDPKGDLTNLLLHFPELRPADFLPWIDPEQARREEVTPEALAESTAAAWRDGLAKWGLGPERIARLAGAVDYTIFTPGSTAGMPVNLLSSFEAPSDWQSNREALRERIASIVTALLGLVGMTEIDPLRSREHILLANILETAWSQGKSLDLPALIEQVTRPPFSQLGAFPLERFFPEKDRFELALLLNNFLAAPSFQTWLEGQPLDGQALLYTPDGRPRCSIFYLAHMGDNERMFFVTLLLAAVESWMRSQRGTSGLRALLAFDEIVGYLPPVANPPSRPVLLRLLKQARAFGLGLVLSTQNPMDLNYKALSNAGTWFIGRLQTERDKERLLEGLQSLETGIDRASFDRTIARLGKRQFLLHNVHAREPGVFATRWAMNYLAGPLTRAQLPALRKAAPDGDRPVPGQALRGQPATPVPARSPSDAAPRSSFASEVDAAVLPAAAARAFSPVKPAVESRPAELYTAARPPVPQIASEYFIPATVSLNRALAAQGGAYIGPLEPQGLVYQPALLAQAEVRYLIRKYNLDGARRLACLVPSGTAEPERPDWDAFTRPLLDEAFLGSQPEAGVRFKALPGEWTALRTLNALQRDFTEWVYRSATLTLRVNEELKVYASPEMPDHEFRRLVEAAASQGMAVELDKLTSGYERKLETIARRIERQQIKVERQEDEVGQRKAEQTTADLEFIAGLFTRRKRSVSRNVTRRRMTSQARGELDDAEKVMEHLQAEYKALVQERDTAIRQIERNWQARVSRILPVVVSPLKKDIHVELFGIAWLPYHQVKSPKGMIEAAAF